MIVATIRHLYVTPQGLRKAIIIGAPLALAVWVLVLWISGVI
jgi:hypothetical protein